MLHHTAIGTSDHVLPGRVVGPYAEWPLKTLHARPAAVPRMAGVGALETLATASPPPREARLVLQRSAHRLGDHPAADLAPAGGGTNATEVDPSLRMTAAAAEGGGALWRSMK